ncbi:MAG: DUF2092 domain-containing protein [Armatimonadetes bacterium]|nr:DUF2092 domain-containing protein [Armatimonadota bacterium]MDW8029587.1 DUF2092 domain-containing protein [Armatimonadota bacterium]
MRSAGWLFFFYFFVGLTLGQGADAKKLLETIATRYEKSKAILLEGTITTITNTTKSPSAETKVVTVFSLVFQKPNRFKLVLKDGQGQIQQVFVSDGSNAFLEFPILKQVVKRPAPKEGLPIPGGEILSGSLKEQLAKVKEAKIVGEEKIGQRKAKVIKVVTEDRTTAFLWVAEDLLWQTKVTIEGKRLASSSAQKGQTNPFAEAMRQATITQTISFTKIAFNPQLPANAFAYKPPSGYKVIENLETRSKPKP